MLGVPLAPRLLCFLLLPAATACGTNEAAISYPPYPAGLSGELVRVSGGVATLGFSYGMLRAQRRVEPFRISAHPITREQYATCVRVGVCSAAKLDTCDTTRETPSSQAMALCVGTENAQRFCAWQGARLPLLGEWLLAARGPAIQRFPWGDTAASCRQHPRADDEKQAPLLPPANLAQGRRLLSKEACDARPLGLLEVGAHPAGGSTSGMQDVLLAPRELLGGDNAAPFTQCGTDGVPCTLHGLLPASIDFAAAPEETPTSGYSFRCAWEGT